MILNFIEKYNFRFYLKYAFKMHPILGSILSLLNKSLMISMFPFSTAKYNAVLLNYIVLKFHWKIWLWISLNDIILNFIEWYDFKFY